MKILFFGMFESETSLSAANLESLPLDGHVATAYVIDRRSFYELAPSNVPEHASVPSSDPRFRWCSDGRLSTLPFATHVEERDAFAEVVVTTIAGARPVLRLRTEKKPENYPWAIHQALSVACRVEGDGEGDTSWQNKTPESKEKETKSEIRSAFRRSVLGESP